jgi:hypothetical protein
MIDLAEPLRAALEDFGQDALIAGRDGVLRVILNPAAGDELTGGMIEHSGPVAVADQAEALALGLIQGDRLTIGGTGYQVQAIHADGMGGMILRLSVRP